MYMTGSMNHARLVMFKSGCPPPSEDWQHLSTPLWWIVKYRRPSQKPPPPIICSTPCSPMNIFSCMWGYAYHCCANDTANGLSVWLLLSVVILTYYISWANSLTMLCTYVSNTSCNPPNVLPEPEIQTHKGQSRQWGVVDTQAVGSMWANNIDPSMFHTYLKSLGSFTPWQCPGKCVGWLAHLSSLLSPWWPAAWQTLHFLEAIHWVVYKIPHLYYAQISCARA